MSEGKPTIYEAMAQVAMAIGPVAKNMRNVEGGYGARSIDDVLNAVHTPLTDAGVVVIPEVLEADYATVEVGKNRTQMRQATLRVRYTFYGPNGDSVSAVGQGEALDSADKATNKAMSAAFKYVLLHTFTIPLVGDDADADHPVRSDRPVVEPASQDNRDAVKDAIAALTEGQAEKLRDWWKREKVPPVDDASWVARGGDPFSDDNAVAVLDAITEIFGLPIEEPEQPDAQQQDTPETGHSAVDKGYGVCAGCGEAFAKSTKVVEREGERYHEKCEPF